MGDQPRALPLNQPLDLQRLPTVGDLHHPKAAVRVAWSAVDQRRCAPPVPTGFAWEALQAVRGRFSAQWSD
jgi:hypothetical protein